MARFIDADKLYKRVKEKTNPYGKPTLDYESGFKVLDMIDQEPTADVVEVKHGKWHIMSEDPYDESDCPTEEGWYRIITYDGDEMTDYYFGKPTLTGMGCVYWKNCKKVIRAWAKMDAERNDEDGNR